jgi:hypothetical protein
VLLATTPLRFNRALAEEPGPADSSDAGFAKRLDLYEQGYLSIERHHGYRSSSVELFQGRERRQLDYTTFYQLVGRPDLAQAYTRNEEVGTLIGLVGLGTILTGLAVAVAHRGDCTAMNLGVCTDYDSSGRNIGMGVMLGGAVLGLIGAGVAQRPTNDFEERQLADGYNQHLRERLGLPPLQAQRELHLRPYASSDGGGLRLDASF